MFSVLPTIIKKWEEKKFTNVVLDDDMNTYNTMISSMQIYSLDIKYNFLIYKITYLDFFNYQTLNETYLWDWVTFSFSVAWFFFLFYPENNVNSKNLIEYLMFNN